MSYLKSLNILLFKNIVCKANLSLSLSNKQIHKYKVLERPNICAKDIKYNIPLCYIKILKHTNTPIANSRTFIDQFGLVYSV